MKENSLYLRIDRYILVKILDNLFMRRKKILISQLINYVFNFKRSKEQKINSILKLLFQLQYLR